MMTSLMMLHILDLSKLPSERLDDVLAIITEQQEQKEVLVPLLLFDELPAREAWAKALNIDRVSDDWIPLDGISMDILFGIKVRNQLIVDG